MSKKKNALIGIGGAPTRATTIPEEAAERKQYPIASGVLDYFPDAIAAISKLSWQGNEQHNPNQPLHWARGKSADEADTLMRHFLQRGTLDTDGIPHTVKVAWRALALLQKELEAAQQVEEPVAVKPPATGFTAWGNRWLCPNCLSSNHTENAACFWCLKPR